MRLPVFAMQLIAAYALSTRANGHIVHNPPATNLGTLPRFQVLQQLTGFDLPFVPREPVCKTK